MEAGACYCDFGDPCVFYDETRPIAVKEHVCDDCKRHIPKGQAYVRIRAILNGSWSGAKRCVQCQQIANDYCCGVIGQGVLREMVWELLGVDIVTDEVNENPYY